MEIQRMSEEDIGQVADIENILFSMPWTKEDFCSALSKPDNIYLVAKEKEEVLGYCGLWGIAGEGQIYNVAVKKDFQSKGIGRALITELICLGRQEGLESYTLEVRTSNVSAICLYESVGFKEAGIRKNFYQKPAEDAVIMWLQNT